MKDRLLEMVMERDDLADLDAAARRLALRSLVGQTTRDNDVSAILRQLVDEIDGFGPISPLMRDPAVTDVLVNGPRDVWVERAGRLERTDIGFAEPKELHALIDRVLGRVGARADASHPICDARLQDGSRIHVVLPPIAPAGPLVSIRRFPEASLSLGDLVENEMVDETQARRLIDCVRDRTTIAISGSTGTGKTTLLNALLGEVDSSERVVLIEETPELRPRHNCVSLVARTKNVEGHGEVDLTSLVRAALRMRPDRIIVGEVRGREALAALGAMATGHEGSMVTIHSRAAGEALDRIVSLALQSAERVSERSLMSQARRAIDVVVHLDRDDRLARRVSEITKIG